MHCCDCPAVAQHSPRTCFRAPPPPGANKKVTSVCGATGFPAPSKLSMLTQNERNNQQSSPSYGRRLKSSHSLSSTISITSRNKDFCDTETEVFAQFGDVCVACAARKLICYIPQNSNINMKSGKVLKRNSSRENAATRAAGC